ncbi:glycosyl transferase [Actinacidiphila glaucinigra]|uniref:glycosyltransferase family 2 protein n=1 Tax=Actinacidiphila glaucinigra TaxID=235986 RepID=UPI002DDC88B9|nr:glycosyltransferase family 2 protein [Actinacidiphila glaucinigra]WSD62243.1 glycosyl transferase [Actinacidiphila glaucinigra]
MTITPSSMRKTPARPGGLVPSPATGDADRPGTNPDTARRHDYARHGTLAGPLNDPPRPGVLYRVRYRSLMSREGHRVRTWLLLTAAPLASLGVLVWLLQPRHWATREAVPQWAHVADVAVLVCLGLAGLFRLVAAVSHAHATLVARDPVPVAPAPGTRVALLTSAAPGEESLVRVRATLEGAVRVRHDGPVDVWLLDEDDDPEVRRLCEAMGVRHFTRKGVERWNQPKGAFRAGARHGGHNAWLDAHGDDYEFTASVGTGRVPLPNYLERMLGYFHDPDVAFVVGPQVHGGHGTRGTAVTRAAESHRSLVDASAQRAANRYGSAMFSGTANVVRVSALRQAGGLYDSAAGDLATGLEIHGRRNPATGRKWRSVHTPDVVAVGEGPSSWSGFFDQQRRRSRGTCEAVLRQSWKAPWKLRPGSLLTYTLTAAHYPLAGLGWLLTALACVLFLGLGASVAPIDPAVWLTLHGTAVAFRVALCLGNRGRNVSPHRPRGSFGVAGTVMSAVAAPLYALALVTPPLRRTPGPVAAAEGDPARPDRLATFRVHLLWAALFAGSLFASLPLGHAHAAMRTWAAIALLTALVPLLAWRCSVLRCQVAGVLSARRAPTSRGRHRAPRQRTSTRIAAVRRHLVRR